jgi:hypothetical protein
VGDQYRDQPFGQRLHRLGDQAEGAYVRLLPHGRAVRFGWKRPPISMGLMSPMIRYSPDYYVQDGYLVEVMGCGRDGTLKGLKCDKWAALVEWNKVQETLLWVWNSAKKEGRTLTIVKAAHLVVASEKQFGVQRFPVDDNEYYPIPWAWIQEVGDGPDKDAVEGDTQTVGRTSIRPVDDAPTTRGGGADAGPGP